MEQKLNLVEVLKNIPEGTELYTLIYGTVKLVGVKKNDELFPITVKVLNGQELSLTKDGKYSLVSEGECILFPSKENRNWQNFKADYYTFSKGDYVRSKNSGRCFKIIGINDGIGLYSIAELVSDRKIQGDLTFDRATFINGFEKIRKFDKRCFRPFDRVLVRDNAEHYWRLDFFSNLDGSSEFDFVTINNWKFRHCVPYNSDTENLLGTDDYAPEFYEEECDY